MLYALWLSVDHASVLIGGANALQLCHPGRWRIVSKVFSGYPAGEILQRFVWRSLHKPEDSHLPVTLTGSPCYEALQVASDSLTLYIFIRNVSFSTRCSEREFTLNRYLRDRSPESAVHFLGGQFFHFCVGLYHSFRCAPSHDLQGAISR
eukprot:jgi/Botrbrau1/14596/Bobra.242_2s0006.1